MYLGVFSMHFRVFFKVKVQNGGIFGGCQNFKYFLGVLEIPDFFFFFFWGGGGGGRTVDAGPELTFEYKKREYRPSPPPLPRAYQAFR